MSASGSPPSGADAPLTADTPNQADPTTLEPSKGKGRNRICKTCKFSCTNAREFTNHQRTAHGEGKEEEEGIAPVPASRRSSLRQKRASVSAANGGTGPLPAADDVGTNNDSANTSLQVNTSGPAASNNKGSGTTLQVNTDGVTASSDGKVVSTSLQADTNKPTTGTEISGTPTNLQPSRTAGSTNTSLQTKDSTGPAGFNSSPTYTENEDAMIATSTPTGPHAPVDYHNMSSSFSEDEIDLSEEGGRLVIDDSNALNGSSAVTPTRCGNIQNRTYVCSVCEFTSTAAKAYLRHQRDVHNYEIAIYECDICDYATKYKQKLPRHRKLHFSGTDFLMDPGQASDSTDGPTSTPAPTSAPQPITTTAATNNTPATPIMNGVGPDTPNGDTLAIVPATSVGIHESLPPVIVDDEEDEEDDNGSKRSGSPAPDIMEIPDREPEEKKKKRQEVDPAKYFEVVEEAGTKFACSSCGNSYKWRKSLNKHWKEKHNGETPDNSRFPAGMRSVVQSGHHTPGGRRRLYHNQLLQKITVNQDEEISGGIIEDGASNGSASSSRPETPQNFLNGSYNGGTSHTSSVQGGHFLPSVIGPFITGQPVFPGAEQFKSLTASLNGPIPSQSALDLSRRSSPMDETDSIHHSGGAVQSEPLDLAIRRDDQPSPVNLASIKTEQPWDESPEDVPEMDTSALDDDSGDCNLPISDNPHHKNNVLKCKKCPFVAKTVVDYSAHMTLHLNKKAYKCAACQKHFEQLSLLNEHFAAQHADLITSHKEAIQRIPHGLQQTYHLLKMPLTSIPNLSTQDLGKPDEKQLKCNMCDFVAKWPAELQKHAVSHSEERPFMCMVCGSTYKWKWDMVKHFEKAHQSLSNPYKRREPGTPLNSVLREGASHSNHAHDSDSVEFDMDLPPTKRLRHDSNSSMPDLSDYAQPSATFSQDDSSVAGILAITRAANRMVSRQPNFLDDGPDDPHPSMSSDPMDMVHEDSDSLGIQIAHVRSLHQAVEEERRDQDGDDPSRPINVKTQRAVANVVRSRQNGPLKPHQTKPYNRPVPTEPSQLPYKCVQCEYRARWPSEITQHMKNHSNEKPYRCPLCTYRSKWKWDVVKHMRRCGTHPDGSPLTIKDVIDTTVQKRPRQAPPNAMVMPEGGVEPINPKPLPLAPAPTPSGIAFLVNTTNPEGQATPTVVLPNLPASCTSGVSPVSVTAALNSALSSVASLTLAQFQQSQAAAAAAAAIASSADRTSPSGQQGQNATPKFRSLINGDKYVCLECPFVGNSPAELKRHQMLHSENKPFMCRACGYSSRWKCDLKKHQKVYNHYSHDDQEDSSDKDQPPFTCKTCGLGFPNTHVLATHEKKHAETASNGVASSRFGCKKCDFSANDLASLITHRKSQHPQNMAAMARTSPTPGAMDASKMEEQDEARLKHPRKPMKKFCCSMCDFVCTSRGLLQAHEEEHEREGYCCFYCSNHYQTKDKLLDHISSHPEFNPNEWETFFIEDDDDDDDDTEDVNNNSNVGKLGEAKPTMSSGTLANTIDLTKSGISPPPLLVPVSQLTAATHRADSRLLECEWCSATFAHITTLYQHARNLHPLQLRDQEVAEMSPTNSSQELHKPHSISFASINARAVNLNVASGSNSTVTPSPMAGTALQNSTPLQKAVASLQQRANGQLSSIATSLATKGGLAFFPTTSLATGLTDAKIRNEGGAVVAACTTTTTLTSDTKNVGDAPMNLTTTKQLPQFQCVKCPYVGSTAQAYLRHIEQHSVQAPHACLFCDFSTDRVNKAYLHMRSSHPLEWSRIGQQSEQHMLSLIAKESLRHALQPNTEDTLDVVSAIPVSAMALVNKDLLLQQQLPQSLSITKDLPQQEVQALLSTVPSPLLPSAQNPLAPLFRKRRSPSYQGIPVQQLMADGRRIYQCLLCQFISANVASVAAHTRDAHGPQGKYQCCYCNFSVDNLKLIQHHQETAHPNQRIAIDVLYLEELSPHVHAPTGTVNMHKLVKMTPQQQDISKPVFLTPKKEPFDETSKPEKMLRCLQCPFMVPTADRLRQHMRCHNNNGKYQCRECDFSTNEPALLLEHAQVHEPGYTGSLASGITMALHSLQSAVMNNPPHSRLVDRDSQPGISTPRNNKETSQLGALDLSVEVTAHDQALNQQAKSLSQKIRATGGGSGRIRYCCSECPYHTFCRNNIVKHRRQHLIKNRFQCEVCSYSASRAFLLQQHERFHQEAGSTDTSATKHYQDLILDPFDPTVESSFTGDDDIDDQEDEEMEIEAECDDNGQSGLTALTADCSSLSHLAIEKGVAIHAAGKTADKEAKEIMEAEEADTSGKCTPSAENAASIAEKQFRTYKCQQCPFSSNSPFEFRKHTNFHGTQNRYKCDRCTYSLDRLNLLTQHRKLHSDEPDFDPNPPTSTLLNHEAILRPLSASEAESMRVPLDGDDHHPSPNPSPAPSIPTPTGSKTESAAAEDLLICPSCPYKTPKHKAFSIHSSMHGLRRKYICDFCDWSADRLSLLYQHRRVHSADLNFDPTPIDSIFLNHEFAEDVPGEFEAKILDIDAAKDGRESQSSSNTDSAPSLSPPFKLSITKKMYSCQHCPYVTGNRPSFDYHLSMHGGAGCYTCDSCSYSTERWSLLSQHSRLHDAGQKDKCDKEQSAREAQKSGTVDGSDMEVSEDNTEKDAARGEAEKVKVDSGDVAAKNRKRADSASDLQCQRCPFSAISKHDLIQHVQQHAGLGTMACPYCDFTGADQDDLFPHVQIHFTAPLDLDNLRQLLTRQKKDATPTSASKEKLATPAKTGMESNTDKSEKVGNSPVVSSNSSADSDNEAAKKDDPKKDISSGSSVTDSGGSTEKEEEGTTPQDTVSQKTKVYVCQYCEREFEAKGQMIQHERQHVV